MNENEIFPKETDKTYGLMEIVKGTSLHIEKKPEKTKDTYPNLILREITAFLLLIVVVCIVSLLVDAPLEELANPEKTPNPAKAPWYFLGLQELLHYFPPIIGGVAIPVLIILSLILLPYLDRNPSTKLKERKVVVFIFTVSVLGIVILTVIGMFFRGEYWKWVWPWS
ncbi:MAG: menaquinol oxidoreductase [Candidatus Aminicenantales bacterium]